MPPTDERVLTSRSSAVVRRVRALLGDPKRRKAEARVVVEGFRIVGEALDGGLAVERALIAAGLRSDERVRRIVRRLAGDGVPVSWLKGAALGACLDADTPQGIALIVERPAASLEEAADPARDGPVVVAWQIQDPGNLGALLRTAEAAGACGAVSVAGGADAFHPRTLRGSAGSALRLPVHSADSPKDLVEGLAALGRRLVATSPREGTPYNRADLSGRLALIVGNEGAGLPGWLAGRLHEAVTVPMHGAVESLNVAVSAGVVLFEAARQRAARREPGDGRRA